jgi:hypothetical protein
MPLLSTGDMGDIALRGPDCVVFTYYFFSTQIKYMIYGMDGCSREIM